MAKAKDKKALFLEAFKKTWSIAQACEQVGIARRTFYYWRDTDQAFRQDFEEIQEAQTDFAESKLFELIKQGNLGAIIFYLKTRAKNRGYTEKAGETGQQVRLVIPIDFLPLGDGPREEKLKRLTELSQDRQDIEILGNGDMGQ